MTALESPEESQLQDLPGNRTILLVGSTGDAESKEHFSKMEALLTEAAGDSKLPFKVINPASTVEQVAEHLDKDVEDSTVKRIASLTDLKDINQAAGLSVVLLPSENGQSWSESPDMIRKLSIAFLKGDNVEFEQASQNEDGSYTLTPVPKEEMKEMIKNSEGMKTSLADFQTSKKDKAEAVSAKAEVATSKSAAMPEAEGESSSVKM